MTIINIQKKNWQKYNILGMTINATLSSNSLKGRLAEFKVRFTANSKRPEENSNQFKVVVVVECSTVMSPQVAQARNMTIGEHRHYCVTFEI